MFIPIDLSNSWVVGIGTAIISGLAVNALSRYLWSKKDNSELRQKIDAANHEILYALRPSVAEGSMPTKYVVEALINATARKYILKRESLMAINEFADELIKEIMDSNFLSHDQKSKYTQEVLTSKDKETTAKSEERLGTFDPSYVYQKRANERFAILLAAITSLTSAGLALTFIDKDFNNLFTHQGNTSGALLSLATVLGGIVLGYSFILLSYRHRKKSISIFSLSNKKDGIKRQ